MIDRTSINQVLGGLILQPKLLNETDKYSLTPLDFEDKFDRRVFKAIYMLYTSGAPKIRPIDIEGVFGQDPMSKSLFEQSNGLERVQDLIELAEVENFGFYYNQLKKFNLMTDLEKQGYSIKSFYEKDLTAPRASEINERFKELTPQDIIKGLKKQLVHLESEYAAGEEVEIESLADGIEELVESFGSTEEIGYPIQGAICNEIMNGALKGTLTVRSASSGLGKAIPNSVSIPTPNGFRKVGEIKPGEYLWGEDGLPTRVVAIHPQPEKKEIYKITFKDGRTAECCEDHLWSVYNNQAKDKNKLYTMSTAQLVKKGIRVHNGFHFSVPLNKKIHYPNKEVYPSAYAMGALLGDGTFRYTESQKALMMSGQDEEIIAHTAIGLDADYKKNCEANYSWTFKLKNSKGRRVNLWVEEGLKNYPELWNLKSEEKFIPNDYLYNSIENRIALLQGLLDTDGSIDLKGRISYFTNSQRLAFQVQELCWSLGYVCTISEDTHKETSLVYILHIQCATEEKKNLFRLSRKKNRAIENEEKTIKRERRDNNPIISIESTGVFCEMTCFTVDNDSHLFLMNDYIVTHNTRTAVMDACYLAYPIRYNTENGKWIQCGNTQKVLFIITEQQKKEIQKMVLAYLTDINEDRFRYANFDKTEQRIIKQALEIMKQYEKNFIVIRMPEPTIELINAVVRDQCIVNEIDVVFYDYIFISPSLVNEFKGTALRNDELLLFMATALKNLAVELNVAVFTSTQVNAKADDNKDIRNESSLAGSRAIINKADNGLIMSRPTNDELLILKDNFISMYGTPNQVADVYKLRSGRWTQTRIWSYVDLGRLKKKDLFITNSLLEPLDDFVVNKIEIYNWDDSEANEIKELIERLNKID